MFDFLIGGGLGFQKRDSSETAKALKMDMALTIYRKIYESISNEHISTKDDLIDLMRMMGTMLVTESFRIEDCKTFDEAKKQTLEFYKDICKVVQKITKENENGCNR